MGLKPIAKFLILSDDIVTISFFKSGFGANFVVLPPLTEYCVNDLEKTCQPYSQKSTNNFVFGIAVLLVYGF